MAESPSGVVKLMFEQPINVGGLHIFSDRALAEMLDGREHPAPWIDGDDAVQWGPPRG